MEFSISFFMSTTFFILIIRNKSYIKISNDDLKRYL